jgi:hypothetical protein
MNKIITLLICIGFLYSININAQIIYTDIPDTSVNYPVIPYLGEDYVYYYIDINNDNINDFFFHLGHRQEWDTPSSHPITKFCQIGTIEGTSIYIGEEDLCAAILDINDSIDQNSDWYSGSGLVVVYVNAYPSTYIYCGTPFQDKYYGFSINIGNNMHYGWLQLDANEIGEIVLKGYAFNTIPNQLIKAGQTDPSMIIKEDQDKINISFKNNSLLIKQTDNKELINNLVIYNLMGEKVYEGIVNNYSTRIYLPNIKSGIYVVMVAFDNNIYSKLLHFY